MDEHLSSLNDGRAHAWVTMYFERIDRLHVHPLNQRIYGELKPKPDLVASIKKIGILQPIVVGFIPSLDKNKKDWRHYIVSGHQRVLAAKVAGLKRIPARMAECPTELDMELMLIESNRHREKTLEQKGREFKELKRIEGEYAAIRKRWAAGRKLRANLPTGRARDIAAKKVGMKPRTAEKLEAVIDASDAGNSEAVNGLAKLNTTGRGVDSVYQSIRTPEQRAQRKIEVADRQAKARTLQALFPEGVEVIGAKKGGFNLYFYHLSEARVRAIAQRLSWHVQSRSKAATA
jgi:ParB-like chromosome segregation protein Spo0J